MVRIDCAVVDNDIRSLRLSLLNEMLESENPQAIARWQKDFNSEEFALKSGKKYSVEEISEAFEYNCEDYECGSYYDWVYIDSDKDNNFVQFMCSKFEKSYDMLHVATNRDGFFWVLPDMIQKEAEDDENVPYQEFLNDCDYLKILDIYRRRGFAEERGSDYFCKLTDLEKLKADLTNFKREFSGV